MREAILYLQDNAVLIRLDAQEKLTISAGGDSLTIDERPAAYFAADVAGDDTIHIMHYTHTRQLTHLFSKDGQHFFRHLLSSLPAGQEISDIHLCVGERVNLVYLLTNADGSGHVIHYMRSQNNWRGLRALQCQRDESLRLLQISENGRGGLYLFYQLIKKNESSLFQAEYASAGWQSALLYDIPPHLECFQALCRGEKTHTCCEVSGEIYFDGSLLFAGGRPSLRQTPEGLELVALQSGQMRVWKQSGAEWLPGAPLPPLSAQVYEYRAKKGPEAYLLLSPAYPRIWLPGRQLSAAPPSAPSAAAPAFHQKFQEHEKRLFQLEARVAHLEDLVKRFPNGLK